MGCLQSELGHFVTRLLATAQSLALASGASFFYIANSHSSVFAKRLTRPPNERRFHMLLLRAFLRAHTFHLCGLHFAENVANLAL